eukprot:CAMPEP_0113680526 /NCGR_PEP_ID=MMETSP0038_2-20120614/11380_1 /TAXON_ID=2898 /ORGANISM="Cryptomonas paramecium" /LENGTH=139 /DNA_ID=CAMNT_0000598941 /DNA_START=81 /DNA_END=500 /DNA_ORIENTATION=+ /assembly_acc=CAM_ASM_000170
MNSTTEAAKQLDVDDIALSKWNHSGKNIIGDLNQPTSQRRNSPAAAENRSRHSPVHDTGIRKSCIHSIDSFLRANEANRWTDYDDRRQRQTHRQVKFADEVSASHSPKVDQSQEPAQSDLSCYTARIASALLSGHDVWL